MKKNMDRFRSFRFGLGLLAALFYLGCEDEPTPSLFDPEMGTRPAPVISSVTPPDTFAVIGTVIINGSNFSGAIEENFVFFDAEQATVLEASPTRLKVKTPNLVKDSINLKISVYKAASYSNTISYKLEAAVAPVFKFADTDDPWAIACDAQNNLYASLTFTGLGDGVKRITPSGVKTDFSPKLTGTASRYLGMKVGPGDALYGVTFERRILQIPAAGGTATNWVILPNTNLRLNDLDFDRDKNLWTSGATSNASNPDLYRIRPDKNVKSFPFAGTIRSVRVYNDAVYLAGNRNNQEMIWRVPIISADQVGPEEEYFNFSAQYSGAVYAITFAADGDLLIGADAPASLVVVHADKSSAALYPGLFPTKCFSFAWGTGNFLYVTQEKKTAADGVTIVEPQTILTINMLKKGAPYYGRGDQ